jgi:hypothetical protein
VPKPGNPDAPSGTLLRPKRPTSDRGSGRDLLSWALAIGFAAVCLTVFLLAAAVLILVFAVTSG